MNRLNTLRVFTMGVAICLSSISLASSGKSFVVQHSDLANVEVLIVRHAERAGSEDRLTTEGLARAKAYATYFKDLSLHGQHIVLTHLFAEQSLRTRKTLEPLSKALDQQLDTRFETDDSGKLADDLQHHAYGNEVLICWHHSKMPDLISAFGGNPKALLPNGKWPKSTYDWMIDLRFDANGKLQSEALVHEHLMPGDSK